MISSLRKGLRFEQRACKYLQNFGLKLLESNYQSRFGEIDLVMYDSKRRFLCFIEVKFRRSLDFGGAAFSIPLSKQRKLVKTALCYLACHRHFEHQAIRFDALLIQQQLDGSKQFNWIQNAFYAE